MAINKTTKQGSSRPRTRQTRRDEPVAQTLPTRDAISLPASMQAGDVLDSKPEQLDGGPIAGTSGVGTPDGDSPPQLSAATPGASDEGAASESIRQPTQQRLPREERVRLAAYRRFLERGSEHGDDQQDWFDAEGAVDDEDDR